MSKMEGQWYSDEHINRVMRKLYDYERITKKAIECLKELLEMAKDYETVNLIDRLENILSLLEGKEVE